MSLLEGSVKQVELRAFVFHVSMFHVSIGNKDIFIDNLFGNANQFPQSETNRRGE